LDIFLRGRKQKRQSSTSISSQEKLAVVVLTMVEQEQETPRWKKRNFLACLASHSGDEKWGKIFLTLRPWGQPGFLALSPYLNYFCEFSLEFIWPLSI